MMFIIARIIKNKKSDKNDFCLFGFNSVLREKKYTRSQAAEKFLYLFFNDKNSRLSSRSLSFSSSINLFFSTMKGDVSRALHN